MLARMSKKLLAGSHSTVAANSSSKAVWYKDGSLFINILAKPGAKQSAITEVTDSHVGVRLAARAQEGEANSELIRTIAAVLEVSKGRVSIQRGSRGKDKCIRISDQFEKVDTNEIETLLRSKIDQQL